MEKYTKLKNIGKGNMGACYLMRNNDDGRQYVMKQIDLVNMSKRERKQALNEARVLNALKHPNIINYVDSFLARKTDHLCIVMEYADAGDIAARLKSCRGHLKENVILDWFIQTCLAINCVHQKHILHRDVKTQNIFLTSQGIVKVGDFGIARELNNTFDQAHTFVGTPYYLSPELVQE
ncbi:putative serine/threonine-protein kinase nek3, partial [Diplonema papillatum]